MKVQIVNEVNKVHIIFLFCFFPLPSHGIQLDAFAALFSPTMKLMLLFYNLF